MPCAPWASIRSRCLILPRILALIIAVPMLTFLGSMAALYGGGLVAWLYGGISPAVFMSRLRDAISLQTFEVGMIKAPFMALIIGLVACVEGLQVQGSAELLGSQDDRIGGQVDFPRYRGRRRVCRLLRLDRNLADANGQTDSMSSRCATWSWSSSRIACSMASMSSSIVARSSVSSAPRARENRHWRALSLACCRSARGLIEVLGVDIDKANQEQKRAIDRRWGILFQQGALFSSLSVGKNVEFPIHEYLRLSEKLTTEMAIAKLEMVGLSPDVYREYPSELSGGMIKRVGLARALALDPEILFLDEPTSGLDPISAGDFDQLILMLQETLGISVFMVTHDLDSLHRVCDRIAVLGDGKIIEAGPMETMLASKHPWLTRISMAPERMRTGMCGLRVNSGAGRWRTGQNIS